MSVTPGSGSGATGAYVFANTNRTLSVVVPAGTTLLCVSVQGYHNGTAPSVVAYGGVALTLKRDSGLSSGSDFAQAWYLVSPAVGTANLVVQQPADSIVFIGYRLYSDSDTVTPFADDDSAVGSGGTTASLTLSSAADGYVFGACGRGSNTQPTLGASQASIYSANNGGESGRTSDEPGASSVAHSYGIGSDSWAIVAVAIKAAGGAVDRAPPPAKLITDRSRRAAAEWN
jgi:hypothetical protein